MRTIGKIILENGQKVYKRFGAAAKEKIKLGTSAFANIVNNATTTEEGFVPDARVVAQQQETISALQQQVESLNSAMLRQNIFKTEELIDNIDDTSKAGIFVTSTSTQGNNPFGFGVVVIIKRYDDILQFGMSATKKFCARYYYNGTKKWGEWIGF